MATSGHGSQAGDRSPAAAYSELLAKLDIADCDSLCKKTSVETMKGLMQTEVHDNHSLGLFIDTLLVAALDKKTTQKHLILASSLMADSLPALSIAFLLAEVSHHASHLHLKLSPSHIARMVKLLVSWFPLAMEATSQTHALHQACVKLACAVAENAAARNPATTCSSPSSTGKADENSGSVLNSSSSYGSSDEDATSVFVSMESLCRPLMLAAFSKTEPSIRGGTACLQALVSMDSWSCAPITLTEELCKKAVNAIQERKALSVSTAQMSLLCVLAKKNHESLSCFRAGLLKKTVEVLVAESGQWQQRVAAVRLIECLLSNGDHCHARSKQEMQAIEALEECRCDKVAMVRSAVIEALKKAKWQQQQQAEDSEGSGRSTPGESSLSHRSTPKSNSAAVDYGKRRRKKTQQAMQLTSSRTKPNDPFSAVNDGWINRVTPPSGWSSSDSVNSSIDMKCPRKKVAKTCTSDEAVEALYGESSNSASRSTLPSTSRLELRNHVRPSLVPTSPPAWRGAELELSTGSLGSWKSKQKTDTASIRLRESEDSASTVLQDWTEGGMKLTSFNPEEGDHVCLSHVDTAPSTHSFGTEEECGSSGVTPTHVHHNPIAQFQDLEEVDRHEVCQSATKLSDDIFPIIPISLVIPSLENVKLQSTDVSECTESKELFTDTAWNVRNNPIATDDSETDSPRPTILENCSFIYCDDGDDEDDDGKVQAREQQETSHAKQPEESDNYQICYGHMDDVGRDGATLQCGSRAYSQSYGGRERRKWCDLNNAVKQQVISIMGDSAIANESTTDSYDCSSDIEAPEKLPQVQHGSLPFKSSTEDISIINPLLPRDSVEASSQQDDMINHTRKETLTNVDDVQEPNSTGYGMTRTDHVCEMQENCNRPKEKLIDGDEVQEYLNLSHGLNRSVHDCMSKGCCNGCCRMSQEVGGNQSGFGGLANEGHEGLDDASVVVMDEHEGAGESFDVMVAGFDSVPNALGTGEEERESLSHECSMPEQHRMESISIHAEEIQSLSFAKARGTPQATSYEESSATEEEKECTEDGRGQSNKSIVGWLRECFVVKKLGMFGTLFLVLSIPLAVVSLLNTFEGDEETNDFLVPT